MENQKNRIYYKIIESERKHYLENKLNYARFLCRVPDKQIDKFKEIEWNCAYEFQKKRENAENRDRTKLYDFDIIVMRFYLFLYVPRQGFPVFLILFLLESLPSKCYYAHHVCGSVIPTRNE